MLYVFSDREFRPRPYVVDFESGIDAAILAVYYGWIDGINDLLNTPRIAYERHGPLGGVAGTFIALANSLIKPLVGTLSSATWLCRGLYASVNNPMLQNDEDEASAANTLGLDVSDIVSDDGSDEPDPDDILQTAAETTGFKPDVCKRILHQFDKIKRKRVDPHSHEHQS